MSATATPVAPIAKRLASARNSAFEATMNEYSQDSINSATRRIAEVTQEAKDSGLDPDAIVTWNDQRGCWVEV